MNGTERKRRCEKDHGVDNCEICLDDDRYYPKCKPGYYSLDCNICRLTRPKCASLNLSESTPRYCSKKTILGNPITGKCNSEQEMHFGLCYTLCKSGYTGFGTFCLQNSPNDWSDCGMGATQNKELCSYKSFGIAMIAYHALKIVDVMNNPEEVYIKGLAINMNFKLLQKLYESNIFFIQSKKTIVTDVKKFQTHYAGMKIAIEGSSFKNNDIKFYDIMRNAEEFASTFDTTRIPEVNPALTYNKCPT